MNHRIYKVIKESIYDYVVDVDVKVFKEQQNAIKYFQEFKEAFINNVDIGDDSYCIDEDSTSFERYLSGSAVEDSFSIYISEDIIQDMNILE